MRSPEELLSMYDNGGRLNHIFFPFRDSITALLQCTRQEAAFLFDNMIVSIIGDIQRNDHIEIPDTQAVVGRLQARINDRSPEAWQRIYRRLLRQA